MENLNSKQFESLKMRIETDIPLQGLLFKTPYEETEQGIKFVFLERYSYNLKIIYVIVPLQIDEQFCQLKELEEITKKLCNVYEANLGFFGTCSFEDDVATYLIPNDHQIERFK